MEDVYITSEDEQNLIKSDFISTMPSPSSVALTKYVLLSKEKINSYNKKLPPFLLK